jgi:hypothetical protein
MKTGVALALAICGAALAAPALAAETIFPFPHRNTLSTEREEVYVFRTTRTERTRGTTPACAAARFESVAEDHYTLWSIATGHATARVKTADVASVGEFRACFAAATPGRPFGMSAFGAVAGIAWSGYGECTPVVSQPPESTVRAFTCNLTIEGLPEGYDGGWLTSSTVAPVLGASAPADAHVPGYLSTSIVTLRLWKTATARNAHPEN